MKGRVRQILACAGLVVGLCGFAVAPAVAADGNSVPPDLELFASGTDQEPLGLHGGSLAYYETSEPDSSWGYANGSDVTFTCLVDGRPTACSKTYHDPCCPVAYPLAARVICPRRRNNAATSRRRRPCRPPQVEPVVPDGKVEGLGPATGWVPIPKSLPDGPHSITVIAADEDGVDPDPPTVVALYDITPPKPPRLLLKPRRISHQAKPVFRYSATDARKLYDDYNDPFSASLKRIEPPGKRITNANPFGNYLEWRGPFCPTHLRCSETSWAAYSAAGEGGTSFGIRERLSPGLYEFRVSATDAASNESADTKYRFRVLDQAGH